MFVFLPPANVSAAHIFHICPVHSEPPGARPRHLEIVSHALIFMEMEVTLVPKSNVLYVMQSFISGKPLMKRLSCISLFKLTDPRWTE